MIGTVSGDGEVSERTEQNQLLALSYHGLLRERPPFNEDINRCSSPGSAYLYMLEQEHVWDIPQNLTYETLQRDIPDIHQYRIRAIWEKVQEHRKKFERQGTALKRKWDQAPRTSDPSVAKALKKTSIAARGRAKRTLRALISIEDSESIQLWQDEEKSLRAAFDQEGKTYRTALRLYYALLLERPDDGDDSPPVLPLGHPLRRQIVSRNRHLEVIDATYQTMKVAKTGHHGQKSGRIRKGDGGEAFANHAKESMSGALLDVVEPTIDEERLPIDLVLLIIACGSHDLPEDSVLDESAVMARVREKLDEYAGDLDPVIVSGFSGRDRTHIIRKVMNILGRTRRSELKHILRILSNNTSLTKDEFKTAIRENLAGELSDKDVARWWGYGEAEIREARGIDAKEEPDGQPEVETIPEPPTLKTFREFPTADPSQWDSHPKMDMFVVRHAAITQTRASKSGNKIGHLALIAKMEDRAHNLKTLSALGMHGQLRNLRGTTRRLIPYAMWDHDRETYPLYNTLPRLIRVTLTEYERAVQESKRDGEIIPIDHENIRLLREWAEEIPFCPRRPDVAEMVTTFKAAQEEAEPRRWGAAFGKSIREWMEAARSSVNGKNGH